VSTRTGFLQRLSQAIPLVYGDSVLPRTTTTAYSGSDADIDQYI